MAAVAGLSAILLAACDSEPEAPAEVVRLVEAIRVGDADQIANRFLPGRAQAHQELTISFRVPGQLVAFPIAVGDHIEEGDCLAGLVGLERTDQMQDQVWSLRF